MSGNAAPVLSPTLAIQAEGVAVGYQGRPVVTGIDVAIRSQTSLALVGTNGSGKSTLLRSIVGLLPVLDGELRVLGAPPGGAPARIAYLSQFHASGFVLPLQATDIVRMARFPNRGLVGRMTGEDDDLVAWALRTMGVDDLARQPLRLLSGGQQQRIYLSQVLPLTDKTYPLTGAGEAKVNDRPAVGVKVTARGHRDVTLYFDKESGLLLVWFYCQYVRHRVPCSKGD